MIGNSLARGIAVLALLPREVWVNIPGGAPGHGWSPGQPELVGYPAHGGCEVPSDPTMRGFHVPQAQMSATGRWSLS